MIPYQTYQGTGNDFVAIDAADAAAIDDPGAFARAVCDRETGIGAGEDVVRTGVDGVLVLEADPDADPARVRMQLYQPDGGTAAMCGNGVRCVAAWASRTIETAEARANEEEERANAEEALGDVVVETPAGDRRATVHHEDGQPVAATVEMGTPSFAPADVPMDRGESAVETTIAGRELTAVTTGVPHAVAFVEAVDEIDLNSVAPPIRHADVFPDGTNVTVAALADDGDQPRAGDDPSRNDSLPRFQQRTYERGVEGETRACGTGAVAILAAARRTGRLEAETAIVEPPGGRLRVTVPDEGPATLRGPVETTFSGALPPDAGHIADATIEVTGP